MDLTITFPGGRRVDVAFGEHVLHTDQTEAQGGEGAAPEPFDLFVASMGACAGANVLAFCRTRDIPTDGIALAQRCTFDAAHRLTRVEIDIQLPEAFPEKYRNAVRAAADACKVKKTLAAPPEITIRACVVDVSSGVVEVAHAHP